MLIAGEVNTALAGGNKEEILTSGLLSGVGGAMGGGSEDPFGDAGGGETSASTFVGDASPFSTHATGQGDQDLFGGGVIGDGGGDPFGDMGSVGLSPQGSGGDDPFGDLGISPPPKTPPQAKEERKRAASGGLTLDLSGGIMKAPERAKTPRSRSGA